MSTTLKITLKDLIKDKESVLKASAPYRASYEKVMKKIAPLEVEARELSFKIRQIEQPTLADLNNQIIALAKALKLDPTNINLDQLDK